jgi:large subunit ribosomal protein L25
METRKISAKPRSQSGRGAARRLRQDGHIPAIAYGKELGSQALAVSPKDLGAVLESPYGRNSVIELDVDGKSKLTVLCTDSQHHPVSRALLHADFLQIHLDRPVDVEVPFELTGKAKGVILGGVVRQVFRRLPVRCLPEKIPVKISHDITEIGLDESLAASQIALPEGVSIRLPPNQTVAAVVTEKVRKEEEEAPAAGAAGAAAPAAAGAAGAAAPAEKKAEPEKAKK